MHAVRPEVTHGYYAKHFKYRLCCEKKKHMVRLVHGTSCEPPRCQESVDWITSSAFCNAFIYSLFIRCGLCSIRQAYYQLIVVDEPQPMILEVSAQCHELTFIEMQSWGVMAKFITETLFIQLACKIVKQSVWVMSVHKITRSLVSCRRSDIICWLSQKADTCGFFPVSSDRLQWLQSSTRPT